MVQLAGHRRGGAVDPERERPDHEEEQHFVMPHAPQLLDSEMDDGGGPAPRHRACFRSSSRLIENPTGMTAASAKNSVPKSAKPSALLNVPRLIIKKYVMGKTCPMRRPTPSSDETGSVSPQNWVAGVSDAIAVPNSA